MRPEGGRQGRGSARARAAALALALGCGTGATPIESALAPRPAPAAGRPAVSPLSFLTDEFERVFPARVRLARYGALRLHHQDPEPAIPGHGEGEAIALVQSPALVVVDAAGGRLRVVVEEGEYRLLVWIEASDLHWVVSETTDLALERGEPAAAPPAPGVRLRPGLPVLRREQAGSMALVSHEDQCVAVTGWIPVDRLSRQYVPVDQPEEERTATAPAGAMVLERPAGRVLARFTSECHVVGGGREEAGHRLITYQGSGVEVRGWIGGVGGPSGGALGALFGYGGGGFGFGSGERVMIPAGTCLYAARGGPVVGVATDDAEESGVEAREGGWHQLAVATGWGDLPVWVVEDGAQSEVDADEDDEAGLMGLRKVKRMGLRSCR